MEREEEQGKEEKEEEKEAVRKQGEEGGDGRKGQGRDMRGGGLSAFDVKSLRQKHSGAECCSTCAGNPQCQRQLGDGEDEGGEIKNRNGGNKMRNS